MAKKYLSASAILAELGEAAEIAAKDALAEGAEMLVQEAKSRCPIYDGRDKRAIKGALRDSIHAIRKNNGAKYRVVADAQAQDGLYYGKIVEFSPRINKPFMYPAMDACRKDIQSLIIKAVREAIRRK